MKPTYRLFINGEIIEGPLKQLQTMGRNSCHPYEIYVYYRACTTASSGNLKLTFQDMVDAKKMRESGFSFQSIAKKYHITPEHMSRIIRKMMNGESKNLNTNT